MRRNTVSATALAAVLALAWLAPGASIIAGEATPAAPAPAAAKPPESADQAAPKLGKDGMIDKGFAAKHESFLKRGKEGPIGVLFVGDSITAGWGSAKDVWESHYGTHQPANFGIGGDRTQHVLWRIANGELDGITPKVVVLMIGTNNIGDTAENITKGDVKIAAEIHAKLPQARLLLLGIFPRGADPKQAGTMGMRSKIAAVNAELAKLDDGAKTRYLDIGSKFLDENGVLTRDVMPDALHPNARGYQIWAEAMQPLLDEMLK
jgi:lysophospholipase L1-like esterase